MTTVRGQVPGQRERQRDCVSERESERERGSVIVKEVQLDPVIGGHSTFKNGHVLRNGNELSPYGDLEAGHYAKRLGPLPLTTGLA